MTHTILSLQRRGVLALPVALALLTSACGGSSDPSPSDGGSTGNGGSGTGNNAGSGGAPGSGGQASTGTLGAFSIGLVRPRNAGSQGHTQLIGTVYKGPYPYPVSWSPSRTDGECRLLVPSVPFCDPLCGSGSVCVSRNQCVASPSVANLGTVTVSGVRTASGATEFTMMPLQGSYQPGAETGTLPYPAFDAGADIRIQTSGGDLPAFSLSAKGIPPLEVTSDSPVRVAPSEPVELTWEPSTVTGSRVMVKLDVSHHGGSKGLLDCEAADDGSLTIPAALVTELLGLGVAGFPSIVISRVSAGETSIAAGKVNLIIESAVESPVEIPGLVSCVDDDACMAGQTCNTDVRKCE